MKLGIFIVSLTGIFLAGCHQYSADDCKSSVGATVEAKALIDDRANEAYRLEPNAKVLGRFSPPAMMRVDEIGVQIGNNGGSATGDLSISLCQGARCVTGIGTLNNSIDNDYLSFKLSGSLPIDFQGGPLTYELYGASNKQAVVVWVYPTLTSVPRLNIGVEEVALSANIILRQN